MLLFLLVLDIPLADLVYLLQTKDEKWKDRTDKLLQSIWKTFFPQGIAYEASCEPTKGTCTPDMLSFKGYLHRWVSVVGQLIPDFHDEIEKTLQKSAEAAVSQCTGGDNGRTCGFYWSEKKFYPVSTDHTSGAGEAMNVLAAVSSLLRDDVKEPATNKTGGTSKGDPNAGNTKQDTKHYKSITTADKAGAWILTLMLAVASTALLFWVCHGEG